MVKVRCGGSMGRLMLDYGHVHVNVYRTYGIYDMRSTGMHGYVIHVEDARRGRAPRERWRLAHRFFPLDVVVFGA